MNGIIEYLKTKEDFQSVVKGLDSGLNEQLVAGLSGTARGLFVQTINATQKRPKLIITHQLLHAQKLYEDLLELSDEEDIYLYPVNELITSEMVTASPELRSERIKSITAWKNSEAGVLIAPVAALKRYLPPPAYWEKYQIPIIEGESVDLDNFMSTLIEMGYERVKMVTSPAEFSLRGGIIDVYPIIEARPIRIELFDDEVDSIRYFDADTQRSLHKISEITIGPSKEILLTPEDLLLAADRLEAELATSLKNLKSSNEKEKLMTALEQDIEKLRNLESFQDMYKYGSLFYETPTSLLDYLPSEGVIIFDEMSRIQETMQHLEAEETELYHSLLEGFQLTSELKLSHDWEAIKGKMPQQKIYMSVFLRHIANTQPENIVNLSSRPMQEFHGQMPLFKGELTRWQKAGYSVVILTDSEERVLKVQSILADYGMTVSVQDKLSLPYELPVIAKGNISAGLELPLHKLAIITEHELFKQKRNRVVKKQASSNAERIKNYQELKVGDYIVHRNHGIGKYLGVETLEVNKLHKDYLLIN